MTTLYLCGAGNPEGVRLALNINKAQNRWDRIVILDDNPSKHNQSILGVEIAGPFAALEQADPDSDEVSNMVARTTQARRSALRKIKEYGLPLVALIHPAVDTLGVEFGNDITVYPDAQLCANSTLKEGAVVLMRALVGHGSHVGRGCVVAPGAIINARVQLGEGVYIGTNASIMPDLKIGPWATIGANSAVVQDVPAGATVMGVPAQVLMPGSADLSGATSDPLAVTKKRHGLSNRFANSQSGKTEGQSQAFMKLRIAQEKFIAAHQSNQPPS